MFARCIRPECRATFHARGLFGECCSYGCMMILEAGQVRCLACDVVEATTRRRGLDLCAACAARLASCSAAEQDRVMGTLRRRQAYRAEA